MDIIESLPDDVVLAPTETHGLPVSLKLVKFFLSFATGFQSGE